MNISLGLKGKMSGQNHPMFGKKFSIERKGRISQSLRGHTVSEETKLKLSKAHTGKILTDEHREKIRERTTGEKNPMFGKTQSDEARRKISVANKGKLHGNKNPSARPIIQLTKDDVFVAKYETGKDGALSVNGDLSAIIKCCRGKRKTSHGFKWVYEEDYIFKISSS